jgi:hypothetical protein
MVGIVIFLGCRSYGMVDFDCRWIVVCDDRCWILWWCLVLSGAGAGDGGGFHWMIVKFCEEELCWWISNVFLVCDS